MAKGKGRARGAVQPDDEPSGLWHQPALMNLLADLLIVLAVAGLAWAVVKVVQRLPVFPLREIIVTEVPKQVSLLQVEHAARSVVTGNFFTVNLEAARATFEKLPWVRKVSLQRSWPDGLALTIEEHEAIARWRHVGGELAMLNRHGEIFSIDRPVAADGVSLPLLSGPDGSARELLARFGEFTAALAVVGRTVESVTLSPRRAWQLKLDDGMVLELGRDQEKHPLAERLGRFVAHYDKVKQRVGDLKVADMRYPNGFALAAQGQPARPAGTGRKS